jgi:hypothetical protein
MFVQVRGGEADAGITVTWESDDRGRCTSPAHPCPASTIQTPDQRLQMRVETGCQTTGGVAAPQNHHPPLGETRLVQHLDQTSARLIDPAGVDQSAGK